MRDACGGWYCVQKTGHQVRGIDKLVLLGEFIKFSGRTHWEYQFYGDSVNEIKHNHNRNHLVQPGRKAMCPHDQNIQSPLTSEDYNHKNYSFG